MVRLIAAVVRSLLTVRGIAFLIGLVFITALGISAVLPREAVEETASHVFHLEAKQVSFPSDGPLGRFNRAQLQRGFQVYKEVCSACHGLGQLSFRNLNEIGFSEAEVKAIANQWAIEIASVNSETGEATTRKPIPSDRFPNPYANEVAARAANNNALPPDLSLITKAREGHAPYIYSLLTGYQNPPARLLKEFPDAAPGTGLYYNPYYPNLNIAMPPPIVADGQVTYAPGQPPATVDQMSKDVSAFLVWTAEPRLENRHRTGVAVLIFLTIATVLAYLAYRNIWADKKKHGKQSAYTRTGGQHPSS